MQIYLNFHAMDGAQDTATVAMKNSDLVLRDAL